MLPLKICTFFLLFGLVFMAKPNFPNCQMTLKFEKICVFYKFNDFCTPWNTTSCERLKITRNEFRCPKYKCDLTTTSVRPTTSATQSQRLKTTQTTPTTRTTRTIRTTATTTKRLLRVTRPTIRKTATTTATRPTVRTTATTTKRVYVPTTVTRPTIRTTASTTKRVSVFLTRPKTTKRAAPTTTKTTKTTKRTPNTERTTNTKQTTTTERTTLRTTLTTKKPLTTTLKLRTTRGTKRTTKRPTTTTSSARRWTPYVKRWTFATTVTPTTSRSRWTYPTRYPVRRKVEGHSTTSTTCSSTTSTATKLTTLRSSPTTSTAKTTTAAPTLSLKVSSSKAKVVSTGTSELKMSAIPTPLSHLSLKPALNSSRNSKSSTSLSIREKRSDIDCGSKICFLTYQVIPNCFLYLHNNNTNCEIPCNLQNCTKELHHFITCPVWRCHDLIPTTTKTTTTTARTTTTSKRTTTSTTTPKTTTALPTTTTTSGLTTTTLNPPTPVTLSPLPPLDHPGYLYSSFAVNILLFLILSGLLIAKCKKAIIRRIENRRNAQAQQRQNAVGSGDIENDLERGQVRSRVNMRGAPRPFFSNASSSSEDFETGERRPLIHRPRSAPTPCPSPRVPSFLNSPILPARFLNSPGTSTTTFTFGSQDNFQTRINATKQKPNPPPRTTFNPNPRIPLTHSDPRRDSEPAISPTFMESRV